MLIGSNKSMINKARLNRTLNGSRSSATP
uniref:Uncharacterized protein n=1 Tax=Anguilla anguilla TaxID=7936 RepID=A0A0E9VYS3_ANGAN